MACFKPLEAWQSGELHPISGRRLSTFRSQEARKDLPRVSIPCGQCLGCRKDRAVEWQTRIRFESQQHEVSVFLSYTYDDQHLPEHGSLSLRDWQLFRKRLRNTFGPFKFFNVGEYGERTNRPHGHVIGFGLSIPDIRWREDKDGLRHGSSKLLDECWGKGHVDIAPVSDDVIAYITGYVVAKATGELAAHKYRKVDPSTGEVIQLLPEYASMSKRPPIGAAAMELFQSDFYPSDFVARRGGGKAPVPRYFDKVLKRADPEAMEAVKVARIDRASSPEVQSNSTPERLKVREVVARAKLMARKAKAL